MNSVIQKIGWTLIIVGLVIGLWDLIVPGSITSWLIKFCLTILCVCVGGLILIIGLHFKPYEYGEE